jgi:hypothetical protein
MTTIRHSTAKVVQPDWPLSGGDMANMSSGRMGCLIVTTWHAAINFLVPIGYEDETGFHYGESPARNGHSELTTF